MKAFEMGCIPGRLVAVRLACTIMTVLGLIMGLPSTASAAEKPPLSPDTIAPFTTGSRISATIEFALPALASEIEQNIPRRLATIDERISCVHRRVLIFRVNANCDIDGFIERSGPVSLYGRGDAIYGSVPIYGALEGEGANRFTARIRGETEASAVIEVEARPKVGRDWSLDLNFSDGFHWSEPPILHVLGREISLVNYAEPRIRDQLTRVSEQARAAARRQDLQGKAASAWQHAFEPVQLSDNPAIWLQMTPQGVAFAGVRADGKVLWGSLELSGSATTFIDQQPPAVMPTPLPALGSDVSSPGEFDVVLPARIGYDIIKDRIVQAANTVAPTAGMSVRDVQVYPSAGQLVIGLRIAKASDADPAAGQWIYLTGAIQVDTGGRAIRLADLGAIMENSQLSSVIDPVISQLRDKTNIDYGVAYQNLLNAASEKLTRPLKNGFRMEGRLSAARFEKAYLLADGVMIALHAGGELKIIYGM
ncbi:MAG TPA: DUF4403 family protein [Afipia sp.]